MQQLFDEEQRHYETALALTADMYDLGEIPRVGAPARRSLLVRKKADKAIVIHGRAVAYHFERIIEKIIFLIRVVRLFLYLFEFEIVPALFAYLRTDHYAEFESVLIRIIFNYLAPEAEHVKIQYMRMPGITFNKTAVALKEIAVPQREVPEVGKHVIRANGIVSYYERRLHDVNEVKPRVAFQHVPQAANFEPVVIFHAVTLIVIPEAQVRVRPVMPFAAVLLPAPQRGFISLYLVVNIPAAFEQLTPMSHEQYARRKIIYTVEAHFAFEFVLEILPREVRESHIVFEKQLKRLIPEHDGLRKRHIRYSRRFAFTHSTAYHSHYGTRVYEPAVPTFEVFEPHISYLAAETVEQHYGDYYPYPYGYKRHGGIKIENELIYLRIYSGKIKGGYYIEVKRKELNNYRHEIERISGNEQPCQPIPFALTHKRKIPLDKILCRDIYFRAHAFEYAERFTFITVIVVLPCQSAAEQDKKKYERRHGKQKNDGQCFEYRRERRKIRREIICGYECFPILDPLHGKAVERIRQSDVRRVPAAEIRKESIIRIACHGRRNGIRMPEQPRKEIRQRHAEIPQTLDKSAERMRKTEKRRYGYTYGDRYGYNGVCLFFHMPQLLQPVCMKYPATMITATRITILSMLLNIFM